MKITIVFLLCVVMLLATAGCHSEEEPPETMQPLVTDPTEPLMPEIDYLDISEIFFAVLGTPPETCGLPEELVFLTGEQLVGYDYVAIGTVPGNLTCYYNEDCIYAAVFGSQPYENQDSFLTAFECVNQLAADYTGSQKQEAAFIGGNAQMDSMESLFAGSGVMLLEYTMEDMTVSVTGCGVNGVATVVLECKLKDGGAQ